MIHVASMHSVRHPLILQLVAVPLDGLVILILNVSNVSFTQKYKVEILDF